VNATNRTDVIIDVIISMAGIHHDERSALGKHGRTKRPQRPLWARRSKQGTKNPNMIQYHALVLVSIVNTCWYVAPRYLHDIAIVIVFTVVCIALYLATKVRKRTNGE
jgi:multisubunit Na+/H+ antiporter MnhC subunit